MINLQKGQTIDLKKNPSGGEFDLSKVTIGLGWDCNERNTGSYDLDAIAAVLGTNGKMSSGKDLVYYGEKNHVSGNLHLTGDNLTGAGEGDDEQIIVSLEKLDQKYDKIVFFTSIYQGKQKGQHFGDVKNAYIRAVDANNKEIAKFEISGNKDLNDKRSLVFAEVYRKDGTWKFRALGEAKDTDSLSEVAKIYS